MKFKLYDDVKFTLPNGVSKKGTIVESEPSTKKHKVFVFDDLGDKKGGYHWVDEVYLWHIDGFTDAMQGKMFKPFPMKEEAAEVKCSCSSAALFNYGCKCGAIKPYDVNKSWK
jgi:hypothetical protein